MIIWIILAIIKDCANILEKSRKYSLKTSYLHHYRDNLKKDFFKYLWNTDMKFRYMILPNIQNNVF